MTDQFKPTKLALRVTAERTEAHAQDALQGRVIVGEAQKTFDELDYAAKLRHAMTLRTITERRQYLGWGA